MIATFPPFAQIAVANRFAFAVELRSVSLEPSAEHAEPGFERLIRDTRGEGMLRSSLLMLEVAQVMEEERT
jgi:hypothetical protein